MLAAGAGRAGDAWRTVDVDLQRDAVPDPRAIDDLLTTTAAVLGVRRALLALGDETGLRIVAALGEREVPLPVLSPAPGLDLDVHAFDTPAGAHAPLLDACGLRTCVRMRVRDRAGEPVGVLLAGDARREPAASIDMQAAQRLARMAGDLVERERLQRRTRIGEQIMQAAFSALVVADAGGHVAFANRAAAALFGSGARGLRGMPLATLFPAHLQADAATSHAWLSGDGPGTPARTLRVGTAGRVRTLEATRCGWGTGTAAGIALVLRDVTDALEQQARLERMAHVDALTGLPNRNALVATLRGLLAGRDATCIALVGLDHFKAVNDTLGHVVGDEVLRQVADRVRDSMPAGATCARFGGDEFALVFAGLDAHAVRTALDVVLDAFDAPVSAGGQLLHMDASIGVATRAADAPGDDPAHDVEELIARADLALYRAKATGRGRLMHFDPTMRLDALERRRMDTELRRAHARGEFELHYQPQVDLASGRVAGAEALLRWRHPERGLLPPAAFIDALAASPVAGDVGRWIIERACRDAAGWRGPDGAPLAISINLFAAQVNDAALQAHVETALADSGLDPALLELEITESIALQPDDNASRALWRLRDRGVRLAYDDFGTGFASLSLLQRLPVDRVKIDRSFVRDMEGNASDAAIVRSIVLISRNLELDVTAEGVETTSQADLLRGLGCHAAQGFLYAPALSPSGFADWLATRGGIGHG